MADPQDSAWQGQGMLLLQGDPGSVAAWARRGLLPVYIVPLDGWTAVLPAGPSKAMPPYDNALKTLAGRPVATRLRSAIGLFAVDGNAVVSAHSSRWRALQKWFVWTPGQGVVQPQRLPAGRLADLLAAAGTAMSARRGLGDILVDGSGDAHGFLAELLTLLHLPGFDLLDGGQDLVSAPGWVKVEPDEKHVATFDRIVLDEARRRSEMEED